MARCRDEIVNFGSQIWKQSSRSEELENSYALQWYHRFFYYIDEHTLASYKAIAYVILETCKIVQETWRTWQKDVTFIIRFTVEGPGSSWYPPFTLENVPLRLRWNILRRDTLDNFVVHGNNISTNDYDLVFIHESTQLWEFLGHIKWYSNNTDIIWHMKSIPIYPATIIFTLTAVAWLLEWNPGSLSCPMLNAKWGSNLIVNPQATPSLVLRSWLAGRSRRFHVKRMVIGRRTRWQLKPAAR